MSPTTEPDTTTRNGAVTTDGVEHNADTIISAPASHRRRGSGGSVSITGRGGVALTDNRRTGVEGFLGTTIAGFPNLFVLTGPNTDLGRSSVILMIESQLNHLIDALRVLDRTGAVALVTRRDRQGAYNAGIQRGFDRSVWTTGGRTSW
ncbi:hypothetical protein ACFXKS_37430 [Streptomyces scopuliridis]|uniref:hypothetical protein n=1 Tax=Streptomyces scopuliridis TaxID=452529 RepID=UPI0036C83ECC